MGPVTHAEEVLVASDHYRNDLVQLFTDIRSKFGFGSVHLYDLLGNRRG